MAAEEPKKRRRDRGDGGVWWDKANKCWVGSISIQDISDTAGHESTHVTETVYRQVIVPQIRGGATVMDNVFGEDEEAKSA